MAAHTDSITLTCPICKRDHSAPLVRRVDIDADKTAKEKILRGEFFYFSCPDCGYLSELHYGCLVIDRPIRLMICVAEENDTHPADSAARMAADVLFPQAGNCLLRVVHSAADLAEKLRIFDAGLDDRLVEICKGMSMTRMYIVYTLRDEIDLHHAVQALEKTRSELPEGADQRLCRRNDPDMESALPWLPFGDLVQILDFPEARQAQGFEASEAFRHQQERTKGMFSNTAAISCPLTD